MSTPTSLDRGFVDTCVSEALEKSRASTARDPVGNYGTRESEGRSCSKNMSKLLGMTSTSFSEDISSS